MRGAKSPIVAPRLRWHQISLASRPVPLTTTATATAEKRPASSPSARPAPVSAAATTNATRCGPRIAGNIERKKRASFSGYRTRVRERHLAALANAIKRGAAERAEVAGSGGTGGRAVRTLSAPAFLAATIGLAAVARVVSFSCAAARMTNEAASSSESANCPAAAVPARTGAWTTRPRNATSG